MGTENDYLNSCLLKAEQGHSDAQYNLGYMYYNGEGVSKDYMRMIYLTLLVFVCFYIFSDVIDDLTKNQLQRMDYKIQKECNNIITLSLLSQMGLGPLGLQVTQDKCVDRVWESTKWQDKWLIERLE